MGGRKNIKQKKSKGSGEILGVLKRIYSRVWFMGKEGRLGEHKGSSSRIWRMNECRSEMTREDGYSGRKELQERGATGEVYSKNVI